MHWIYIGALIGIGLMLAPFALVLAAIAIPVLVYAAVCALLYTVLGPAVLSWIVLGTLLAAFVWGIAQEIWKKWFRLPEPPLTPSQEYWIDRVRGGSPD